MRRVLGVYAWCISRPWHAPSVTPMFSLITAVASIQQVRSDQPVKTVELGKHFKVDMAKRQLQITRPVGAVRLQPSFDCNNLAFQANLDFEQLLELADKADLD